MTTVVVYKIGAELPIALFAREGDRQVMMGRGYRGRGYVGPGAN